MADDGIQHGLDDNPQNDAEKGAALGGLGGAAVGAIAGAAAGPIGAVIGAVAGGLVGAGASGMAVGAVDKIDNDNTVTGLGDDGVATRDMNNAPIGEASGDYRTATSTSDFDSTGYTGSMGELRDDQRNATVGVTSVGATDLNADAFGDRLGSGVPNIRTGGTAVDGTPDTRGITEKTADTVTGDKIDDNTGKRVDY